MTPKTDELEFYEITIKDIAANKILDKMHGHAASIFVATKNGVNHGSTGYHPDTNLALVILTELKMLTFSAKKFLNFMDGLPDMGEEIFKPFQLEMLQKWVDSVEANIEKDKNKPDISQLIRTSN